MDQVIRKCETCSCEKWAEPGDGPVYCGQCERDGKAVMNEEITRLRAEVETLRGLVNDVIESLVWNGDGYEWMPEAVDYRVPPREAIAMLVQRREAALRDSGDGKGAAQ